MIINYEILSCFSDFFLQSNLSSAEDIVSVKRTVCRYFNLYLLSSEEEEKSMNEVSFF